MERRAAKFTHHPKDGIGRRHRHRGADVELQRRDNGRTDNLRDRIFLRDDMVRPPLPNGVGKGHDAYAVARGVRCILRPRHHGDGFVGFGDGGCARHGPRWHRERPPRLHVRRERGHHEQLVRWRWRDISEEVLRHLRNRRLLRLPPLAAILHPSTFRRSSANADAHIPHFPTIRPRDTAIHCSDERPPFHNVLSHGETRTGRVDERGRVEGAAGGVGIRGNVGSVLP
mmetsp:Transcript_11390/g.28054  ORF Transcript_11390/g.28054 Transcript_11390/m.28054 type:complete len:228 (+) Transcript_11390:479-1162(+)